MGVRLRMEVGDVERRKREDVLSIDGRGFCSRFDGLFGGVVVPDPDGSPDLVLLCPRVDALPDVTESSVAKPLRPSSCTTVSRRLVRDSRLSREVRGAGACSAV